MSAYHRPVPKLWWLKRRPYFMFVLRELSAIFVALYVIILLLLVAKLGESRVAYEAMLHCLTSTSMIILHVIALFFTVYHSITWFNLTPKVMVIQLGEERVPGYLIAGANYVVWIVVSAVLAWLILKA